ncbi:MAG: hypothetical protein JST83_16420 [Bacteroidetes bacterium]|nr:hypothetical protein [Bacteroidota bacterium]
MLFGQRIDTSAIPQYREAKKFIPAGYSLIDISTGNISAAKTTFIVMALENDEEDTASMFQEIPRTLMVVMADKKGHLSLLARNDSAILCKHCGGMVDPFGGLTAEKDKIILSQYGGSRERWTRTAEFTYSATAHTFVLSKDDMGGFDSLNLDAPFPSISYLHLWQPLPDIGRYKVLWEE